jgi:NADPH-dependent ferric siderophore reductase
VSERFARERVMHELKRRMLKVVRVEDVAARMRRITLAGSDLDGFVTRGPGDHVKVFFPDPATGELVETEWKDGRPQAVGAGEVISRDYTPYAYRAEGPQGPELDLDFVLHGDGGLGGPASAWAAQASPGDQVRLGGPRGSLLPPTDVDAAILVADESALPSVARWLDVLAGVPVIGLFSVEDPATATYLASHESAERDLRWFSGADRDEQVAEALRGLEISEGTFLFLAGEANSLVPLRRYLRRELGLGKNQVEVRGYWKRGTVALDHHAPIDPADPED